ncbi:MAG: hypothetical protein Q8K57_13200 [Thiobacillus sp.]|nr:hypothetical protein [Thiobacillus sp.]MDP3124183.1 hypothetical protein [Thiobacillus sp.]
MTDRFSLACGQVRWLRWSVVALGGAAVCGLFDCNHMIINNKIRNWQGSGKPGGRLPVHAISIRYSGEKSPAIEQST